MASKCLEIMSVSAEKLSSDVASRRLWKGPQGDRGPHGQETCLHTEQAGSSPFTGWRK